MKNNFKKLYRALILKYIAGIIALISTSVYANEGRMYVRIGGGASEFYSDKGFDDKKRTLGFGNRALKVQKRNYSLSSKTDLFAEAAFGYYLTDSLRSDISYTLLFKSKPTLSNTSYIIGANTIFVNITHNIKQSLKVETVLLNTFFDFYKSKLVSFNVGLGLGSSFISGKQYNEIIYSENIKATSESKSVKLQNLAIALHLGASASMTENTHLDFTYSYRNHGKMKLIDKNKFNLGMHALGAAIRFDL
jgi:opacity protein-like surface antigen